MSAPVSVIIPCYQQERWIEAAALSAFKQSNNIVVVYDGSISSSDFYKSEREVSQWADTFTVGGDFCIRSGVCFNRNLGIDASTYEFILPLDADDQLYPDAIERLYAAWQPGTWVYGNHTEIDEDGKVLCEIEAPPPGMLQTKNLTYATFLFHKDDWQKVGGYDPTFEIGAEDYAFQVALAANGVRPVKLDGKPIYKRMIHPPHRSRTAVAMEYWPMLHKLIRRKWPSVFPNYPP